MEDEPKLTEPAGQVAVKVALLVAVPQLVVTVTVMVPDRLLLSKTLICVVVSPEGVTVLPLIVTVLPELLKLVP